MLSCGVVLMLGAVCTVPVSAWHADNAFLREGEFLVDSALVFIPSDGSSPSVAFDGTTYLATWSKTGTASQRKITAARVSLNGELIDSSGISVSQVPAQQADPAIAFGSTVYLVVWSDNRAGTYDIYGTRVDAQGTVLDSSNILIASSSIDLLTPAIVFGGSSFFVIWKEQLSPSTGYIKGRRVSETGIALDTVITLNSPAIAYVSPSVSFDGRNFFAVWSVATHLYGARVDSTGALIDSTNIQIAKNPGYKTNPAVSFDGTHFLAVWQDNRNGSMDLYGARIDTGGTVLDTAALPLITHGDNMEFPALTFTGGTYLLAWQDARLGNDAIYAARIDTEGVALDSGGILISALIPSEHEPALAFSGTAHLLITWAVNDTSIVGSRIDTSGALIDSTAAALSIGVCPQWNPRVSFNGNQYLIAWHDNRNTTDFNVYAARIDTAGSVLDTAMIPVAEQAVDQQLPVVAGSPGNFLVAWQDDRFANIYAARVDTAGCLLDPTGFPLTSANHEQEAPALIYDGAKYFAVWHDRRNVSGTGIYGTRITTSGLVLNPAGIIISYASGENERFPAITCNSSRYLIVWNRDPHILAAALTDSSGTVLDTLTISNTLASDARPCCASDGIDFLVAWEDMRNTEGDIYVTRIDSSGALLDSSGIPLCVVSGNQHHPAVSWDGTYYTVVWEDLRSSLYDIFGARVSNNGSVFNRFPVVTQEGNQFTPGIAAGSGGRLLLAYAGFADSMGNDLVNTTRIWGSLFLPSTGIAEEEPGKRPGEISMQFDRNPAYSQVTVSFTISRAENIVLSVYNASGRKVRTIASAPHTAGSYEITWHGEDEQGKPAQSGVYFCCLQYGSLRSVRKVVFFR